RAGGAACGGGGGAPGGAPPPPTGGGGSAPQDPPGAGGGRRRPPPPPPPGRWGGTVPRHWTAMAALPGGAQAERPNGSMRPFPPILATRASMASTVPARGRWYHSQ